MVKKMDARDKSPREVVAWLRGSSGFLSPKYRDVARGIVDDVRDRGDAALLEYTERFSGARPEPIRVSGSEIARASESLSLELEESFRVAIENVRRFHEREVGRGWEIHRNGATLGQRVRPLRRAGIYVPGGHGAYPSTLLMSVVPAQVAGVDEICVASPPGRDGKVREAVLAVAGLLGLEEVYAVGGAEAVGAMAFGTESIPAVEKIVGPGNDYVIAAKLEVFGVVGIDAPQGPSEVIVIADASAFPDRVAHDLMAQAEHLSEASAILLTPNEGLLDSVEPLVSGKLGGFVSLVLVRNLAQAAAISNAYAPEHAHVISEDHEAVLNDLREVGMVAVGDFTPIALSDYAAGPSHVLPTGGTASWASPRSVHDFTVRTNYMHFTQDALRELGPHVERLAHLEGFENHAQSVRVRLEK